MRNLAKGILAIAAIAAGLSLSAANQFEVGKIGYGSDYHSQVIANNGGTKLLGNRDTQYTVTLNSNTSGAKNVTIGASISNGFYDIALNNIGGTLNKAITVADEFFQVFKNGVETEFWVEIDGVRYSAGAPDSPFTYTVENGEIRYKFAQGGIDFTVNAYEPGTVPSGQPLPGVVAALAIGGAALWVGRRKRANR